MRLGVEISTCWTLDSQAANEEPYSNCSQKGLTIQKLVVIISDQESYAFIEWQLRVLLDKQGVSPPHNFYHLKWKKAIV